MNTVSKNIRIVSIEGNIGSGKSTLLLKLREHFKNDIKIVFVDEPVSEWETIIDPSDGENIIQKFYKDQEKYSFSFQMMAYISRLSLLKKTIENNNNCVIITERSLFTDKYVFAKMLYDDNKIENINYQIYLKWFDTFVNDFPIDYFIYVDTISTNCFTRIMKRSRTGESNIPLEYLQTCHNYHQEMLNILNNVLYINGNMDINENPSHIENNIDLININIVNPIKKQILNKK
jgi:deoxyadenosine/deoxycytidine kinase